MRSLIWIESDITLNWCDQAYSMYACQTKLENICSQMNFEQFFGKIQ